MVLLPGCNCCKPCPSDDSDGEGSYFETDLKDTSIESPSQWSTTSGIAFGSEGLSFTSGYAARCTYIDLSRDAKIEIEVTASTAAAVLALVLNEVAFGSNPAGASGKQIRCAHTAIGSTDDNVACFERFATAYSGTIATVGTTDVDYVATFKYVSGAWTASFTIEGTDAFTDVSCPDFSLPANRFYHGISGTNDAKVLSRYYMKLTYL